MKRTTYYRLEVRHYHNDEWEGAAQMCHQVCLEMSRRGLDSPRNKLDENMVYEFWFTPLGWSQVGVYCHQVLIDEINEHQDRVRTRRMVKPTLPIVYQDDLQVALMKGERDHASETRVRCPH